MVRSSTCCGRHLPNERRALKSQMTLKLFAFIVRQSVATMFNRLSVCLFACLLATSAAAQPPVIFLVRHTERAAISGHVPSDTGLSAAGRARARDLAEALKDAKIT